MTDNVLAGQVAVVPEAAAPGTGERMVARSWRENAEVYNRHNAPLGTPLSAMSGPASVQENN